MKKTVPQRILEVLGPAPLTTGDIALAINETSAATSVALQRLAKAKKIRCSRVRVFRKRRGKGRGGFTWRAKRVRE